MDWSEKTIVFDLDGTLIDSAPDLHAALVHCFSEKNLPAGSLDDIRGIIGQGAKAMITLSASLNDIDLNDEFLADLHKSFLDYYVGNIANLSRPYPGIMEALDHAESRGARLAVCTNKTQTLAERALIEIGLFDRFASVLGADKASSKKPSPAHLEECVSLAGGKIEGAIMVGDSSPDGLSAEAAGIPFIFMTYGYADEASKLLSPAASLESAWDLPAAIQRCFN